MTARRKITDWHVSRMRAEYRRSRSIAKAAAAGKVSLPTAYRYLEDVHQSTVPVFPISLERRAIDLYVSKRLSCRGVVEHLKREMDPAPSQQWVFERVRDAGVLRSRSRADRLQNTERTGIDYDQVEAQSVRLVLVEKRSVREVAEQLGVSRGTVKRAVGDLAPDPSKATEIRRWQSPHPDARARRRRLELVRELREAGLSHQEISRLTGVSPATTYLDLKRLGLTGSRQQPRRAGGRR